MKIGVNIWVDFWKSKPKCFQVIVIAGDVGEAIGIWAFYSLDRETTEKTAYAWIANKLRQEPAFGDSLTYANSRGSNPCGEIVIR